MRNFPFHLSSPPLPLQPPLLQTHFWSSMKQKHGTCGWVGHCIFVMKNCSSANCMQHVVLTFCSNDTSPWHEHSCSDLFLLGTKDESILVQTVLFESLIRREVDVLKQQWYSWYSYCDVMDIFCTLSPSNSDSSKFCTRHSTSECLVSCMTRKTVQSCFTMSSEFDLCPSKLLVCTVYKLAHTCILHYTLYNFICKTGSYVTDSLVADNSIHISIVHKKQILLN